MPSVLRPERLEGRTGRCRTTTTSEHTVGRVTTGSRQAQRWFDRGLAWTYGYNHEEAIACYRRALDADPECAMAWWGIAYAAGPNYNKPWEAFDKDDAQRSLRTAFDATGRANELSGRGNGDGEGPDPRAAQPLSVTGTGRRHVSPGTTTMPPRCVPSTRSMGTTPDVAALFAEAIMNRTPWAL